MEKITEPGGFIFKIRRFSVHDGPGIRTSVFLKGCPLSCIWCHSPEGIETEILPWYDRSVCIACGECVQSCANNAITLNRTREPQIKIDRDLCNTTGGCVNACPTGALQFTGSFSSVSDIISEIEKDMLYYNVSQGGITLTGGEPLYQPEFSINILAECRKRNIHTAIETSLFCEAETLKRISDLTDLFITDLKIFDLKQHIRYTGKSNELIKENFRTLARSGKKIIVRIPMVENITDTDENKNACEKFVHDIDKQIPIEYISFNPLAGNNYERLGIPFMRSEE